MSDDLRVYAEDLPDGSDPTHERILNAARGEFAKHGYHGASVRRITSSAGANLAAVNYHFHNKELLYTAVLAKLAGPLGHRVRFATHAPVPPLEKVERIIRAIFEHIRLNPDMPAIVMREMAGGGEMAGPIKKTLGEVAPLFAGVIRDGQRDGTIRDGDPVLLALSCVAQPVYLNLAKPIISSVAGVDPQDDRVIEHVVTIVRAMLRP